MHKRRGLAVTIVAALSLVLALSLVGGALGAKKKVVKATANMNGLEEVPPADLDGTGKAKFKLKAKKKQVCFNVTFQNIEAPTVAHIHRGKKGVNGPPLVTLFEDAAGASSPQNGCVKANKKLIKKIGKKPKSYYCNLHTNDHPAGAIRGQLKKK